MFPQSIIATVILYSGTFLYYNSYLYPSMKWMNGWLTDWIPHNITLLCRLCWWLFEILITMQIYWRWFTGKSVSHTPATWVPVAVMQLHHLNTSSDTHSSLRVQCTTSITSVVSSVVPLDFRETQTEEATIIIIIGQQKSQRLITICMKPLRNINRSTRKDHRLNVCLAAALPILVQRWQNLTHPSFHHVIYLVYHFTTKWRWYEWTNALASTL